MPTPRRFACLLALLAAALSLPALAGVVPEIRDNSGAWSQRIPLEVPPGPAGSTPSLELVYSSSAGLGDAGQGWSLPYSSIRFDRSDGVPTWWLPDDPAAFCDPERFGGRLQLDGMELVPSPNDAWVQEALPGGLGDGRCVYRTRPDTHALVVPVFPVTATNIAGPSGFAVVQRDGSIWWYGDDLGDDSAWRVVADLPESKASPSASRVTTRWLLRHVEGREGNLVSFWPDRRVEPWTVPLDDPQDRGACNGCLRYVTWAHLPRDPYVDHYFDPTLDPSTGDWDFGSSTLSAAASNFPGFLADPASAFPTGEDHAFFVEVDWEERPDVRTSASSGALERRDRRIRQVSVGAFAEVQPHVLGAWQWELATTADTTRIRSYRLDYERGSTGRSRLTRVWEVPGLYDPAGDYSQAPTPVPPRGAPPSAVADFRRAMTPGKAMPMPWEFEYSEGGFAPDESGEASSGSFGTSWAMEVESTQTRPVNDDPAYLGAHWVEGGFPTIVLQDVNGDGLSDLVQHDEHLPAYANVLDNVVDLVLPYNDLMPGIHGPNMPDLENAEPEFWVRYNNGAEFTPLEPFVDDPFAGLSVRDFFPELDLSGDPEPIPAGDGLDRERLRQDVADALEQERSLDEAEEGEPSRDWPSYVEELAEAHRTMQCALHQLMGEQGEHPADDDDSAGHAGDDDDSAHGGGFCFGDELQMVAEFDPELLSLHLRMEQLEDERQRLDCNGDGVIDEFDADQCPEVYGLMGGQCGVWNTGVPSHLAFPFGSAVAEFLIADIGRPGAGWCEHRSCAPYCEGGTSVTIGPHALAHGGDPNFVGAEPSSYLDEEHVRDGDDTLITWGRYGRVRGTSGDVSATIADVMGRDVLLGGWEPGTKTRFVDGLARSSFQTRIQSTHVEWQRIKAGVDMDDVRWAKRAAVSPNPMDMTVLEGALVDTIDMNGDGFLDRVMGGAAVLHDSFGNDFIWNVEPDASKEHVVTTQHMPWYVSLFNPEDEAYGAIQPWAMPLTHDLLMGAHPNRPPGATAAEEFAAEEVAPGEWENDPRVFSRDHFLSWLGVWEGTMEKSGAVVSSSASAGPSPSGPSAGASISIGPVSISFGASAGGPSMSIGTGPVSFGTNGFSIGGTNFGFDGDVSTSPVGWVWFVIAKALETIEVPYTIGLTVGPNGISVNNHLGGDQLVGDPTVRWQRQGLFDMNGDGRPDYVLATQPGWADPEADVDWVVLLNEGDGWSEPIEWRGVHTRYLSVHETDFYRIPLPGPDSPTGNGEVGHRRGHELAGLRDMNGDGLPDFVFSSLVGTVEDAGCDAGAPVLATGVGRSSWDQLEEAVWLNNRPVTLCVQLNTGLGFSPTAIDWFDGQSPGGGYPRPHYAPALACSRSHIQGSRLYNDGWSNGICGLQDWNGDGLLDFWASVPTQPDGTSNQADFEVWLSDGSRFVATDATPDEPIGRFRINSAAFPDPEGSPAVDGLFDTGQFGFGYSRLHTRPGGSVVPQGLFDIDGDGALDWVASSNGGQNKLFEVTPLQAQVPDLLTAVREPGGAATALSWLPAREFMDLPDDDKQILDFEGADLTGGSGFDRYPASFQVVESITRSDGLGTRGAPPRTTRFLYGQPKWGTAWAPGGTAPDDRFPTYWGRSFGFQEIFAFDDPGPTPVSAGLSVGVRQSYSLPVGLPAEGYLVPSASIPSTVRVVDELGRLWSEETTTWEWQSFAGQYPVGVDGVPLNWLLKPRAATSERREPDGGGNAGLVTNTWLDVDPLTAQIRCRLEDIDGDGTVNRITVSEPSLSGVHTGRLDLTAQTSLGIGAPDFGLPGPGLCDRQVPGLELRSSFVHNPAGRVTTTTTEEFTGGAIQRQEFGFAPDGQPVMSRDTAGLTQWTFYDPTTGTVPTATRTAPVDAAEQATATEVCGLTTVCTEPTLQVPIAAAFGLPASTTSPNGLTQSMSYSAAGLPAATVDDQLFLPTTYDALPPLRVGPGVSPDDALPAWTRITSPIDGVDRVQSATWTDGFGRSVLSGADSLDRVGATSSVWSGWSRFDDRGRVEAAAWPCEGSRTSLDVDDWLLVGPQDGPKLLCGNEAPSMQLYGYDALERAIEVELPDGTTRYTSARVEPAPQLPPTALVPVSPSLEVTTTVFDSSLHPLAESIETTSPWFVLTERMGAQPEAYQTLLSDEASAPDVGQGGWLETLEERDAMGRRESVSRTPFLAGNETVFSADGLGRLLSYSDPDQGQWTFEYEVDGQGVDTGRLANRQLLDATGALHSATEWTYDQLGRPLTADVYESPAAWNAYAPDSGWTWAYDGGSQWLDPSVPEVSSRQPGPIGSAHRAAHWVWSPSAGQHEDVIEEWRSDRLGMPTEYRQTLAAFGDVPERLTLQRAHYANGQVGWMRLPEAGVVQKVGLDSVGRPDSTWDEGPLGTRLHVAATSYDEFGRPSRMEFGNGAEQVWDYEPDPQGGNENARLRQTTVLGRNAQGQTELLLKRDYEWDPLGNLSRWTDASTVHAPGQDWGCHYDGIGQLLGCSELSNPAIKRSFDYAYDLHGNLVHEVVFNDGEGRHAAQVSPSDPGVPGAFPLNGARARVESDEGSTTAVRRLLSLDYDARGQVASMSYHDPTTLGAMPGPLGWESSGVPLPAVATRTFDWNAEGRLRTVTVDAGAGPVQTGEFVYDSSGTRIAELATPDGSGGDEWRVRRFAGVLRTTERPNGDDTTTRDVLFAGHRVAQHEVHAAPYGTPAAPYETTRYFAGDHLGSASIVMDETGQLVSEVRYEPYGRVRETYDNPNLAVPDPLAADYAIGGVEHLFNGKPRNRKAFGLAAAGFELEGYDYGARIYLPELSRWASADSITPDTVWEANPFQYVRSNPLTYVDPDGHRACIVGTEVSYDSGRCGAIAGQQTYRFQAAIWSVGVVAGWAAGQIALELLPVERALIVAQAIRQGLRIKRTEREVQAAVRAARTPALVALWKNLGKKGGGPGKWDWTGRARTGMDAQVLDTGNEVRQRGDGVLEALEYAVEHNGATKHFDDVDHGLMETFDVKASYKSLIRRDGSFYDFMLSEKEHAKILGQVEAAEAHGYRHVLRVQPGEETAWRRALRHWDLGDRVRVVGRATAD